MSPSRSDGFLGAPLLVATDLSGDQVSDLSEKRPLVSVIIPVFNRAKSLAAALRSVAEQTFPDWEAVVVDDGSSDESAEVALRVGQPGKVRVVRHERNQGPSAARNSGILAARGRYVSFLDSDDSWHPEKLSRQLELVEADSNPNMVFCATQTRVLFDHGGVRILPERAPFPNEPWSEFLYVNGGFAQTNSFFLSRDLAMKVGFRSSVLQYEDHLFFLESGAHGARYSLIAEPLSNWNDDSRADRMGLETHLDRSRRFLDEAGGLITEKARLAYEVRHLGPRLFRENPREAIKLFRKASTNGAVRRHHLLAVWARCVLPAPAVAILRRLISLLRS
jgi:glycosyltransferase involved in cell wall biosynthesis